MTDVRTRVAQQLGELLLANIELSARVEQLLAELKAKEQSHEPPKLTDTERDQRIAESPQP